MKPVAVRGRQFLMVDDDFDESKAATLDDQCRLFSADTNTVSDEIGVLVAVKQGYWNPVRNGVWTDELQRAVDALLP